MGTLLLQDVSIPPVDVLFLSVLQEHVLLLDMSGVQEPVLP